MLRKDPFITGEHYHIYNRGIDKRIIFKTRADYRRFMLLLYICNSKEESFRLDNLINQQHKKYEEILIMDRGEKLVSIGAWCLMPNHFHILLKQEIDGGITKFMRKIGTGFSMYFNIKYERKGALFGGLFKSKLIDSDDNYMRQLFAYLHLNPLDLGFPDWETNINSSSKEMKEFIESYDYSSYQDILNSDRLEKRIINLENFPDYFEEINSFKDFVENYFIIV